jgi:predicted metal-dependent HD superfamily phosphohydrolase
MFDCRHAPLALPPELERALTAAYAEPHRAYHTAAHIAEVLRWYDHVADAAGWHDPAAVYLAVVFHDAVYEPLAKDNEARSAALARRLAGAAALAPAAIDRCAELILLTARHGALDPASVASDPDAAHFLDCDTAILGAPPAEFDAYDAAIAAEYAPVPAAAFRAGRRAFLAGLLARPRIFLSELFHARFDAAARANLTRALARYQPSPAEP